MRINELINLRINDIRTDDSYVFIKGAKGKKDRISLLSENLLKILRSYYIKYKPAYWFFEGQEGGKYSATSIQKNFRNIQILLGHESTKTTEVYTHVVNMSNKTIKNPLDNILKKYNFNRNKRSKE